MTPTLQLDRLHFAYEGRPILHGIDLQLMPGEFVTLIGPNGSGKTTLLRCLAGMLDASAGRVSICGRDLNRDPAGALQRLGFAVDPAQLPPLLTGRECLGLFAGARGLPGVPTQTLDLAASLAFTPMLDRRISQYSLGTRQKLGVLLGLLGQPPLLMLDEPINGLDPMSAWTLKRHLQQLCGDHGITVLLATHSLDLAERFGTRALLLIDGRLHREWDHTALAAIRDDPGRSLEQAMVESLA